MNSKFKDLINIKSSEVRMTWLITIGTLIVLHQLNVYSNWVDYESMFKSLINSVIQSFIGLIGIIIAGVAVIISVFTREVLRVMRKKDLVDSLRPIFNSFVFLAQFTVIGIILFVFVYFFIHTKVLIPMWLFYVIIFVTTYIFYFVMFYTVSLIRNIVKMFFITSKFNEGLDKEADLLLEEAINFIENELKSEHFVIDQLIRSVITNKDLKPDLKIEIIKILMK
ncbi:hypothetical protein HNY42_15895 (plasmid) [Exiguobacterium sp. Helios]|uniref:hypothetical protein n=1 Tax=Exiguobacterium sp. Helios TaxID=2735868 RepID=UPI00165E2D26|nr:hypothetical protein [Exiguobacterium sp. Helios]QNR22481.1 hypothetical protein HNY42_15895 [Exiguobacterium sp. Helios]